ncbi:hypothetical protein DYBT9275_05060 [Dyadobacter sp. CECT 9275]|uniref:3-keto-alpha-glucoside-1,2-lyase/3-keto-2-hydroxy-glucal hydratase domain-containing protein n=1 Tax=Dyadobacter helix TaxID=2822344 RepID=A0A916JJ02_9BACT|nr:DUF1080 domain-containing protein [Dyadobacter sp. CECT 9275]CAG5011940.1 hypothetical protein DYBT9275_05060 [Dyadobacter sp. CECT 9275]
MKYPKSCAYLATALFFSAHAATVSLAGDETISKKPKWVTLFDGKAIKGWHNYNKEGVAGWLIENGTLTPDGTGGDLVTDKEYGDFELEFDFKIPPGSNSGVLYKVIEKPEIKRTVFSAPEYQIIDDKGYVFRNGKGEQIKVDANGETLQLHDVQLTGANYDMNPPSDLTAVKAPGEWNKGRIVVNKNHIEHYINGKKVVDYQYGDDNWKTLVKKSKYADWPYAVPHARGKIALQNHHPREKIWFRNIRIKELE